MLAILAAGLTGSLHCALMCGPLASAALPFRRVAMGGLAGPAGRGSAMAAWHAGRIFAYSLVGAALGLAGLGVATALAARVQPVLPWLMALGFVVSAFDLGSRLPPLAALAPWAGRIARAGAAAGPVGRALALGAATPLLPCGLLWGMFLVAIGAGSPAGGALVMALFALGGVPGLATVQLGAAWTGRWPRAERFLRVAVPLVAAAALVWRALMAGGGDGGGHQHHRM